MISEKIVLNETRNVFMTSYIQEVGVAGLRPALLVLPGGGYHICSPREGEAVALAFTRYGYNAFVLNYSVDNEGTMPGNEKWPNPLDDYEQAMEYLSVHAVSFGIDTERIAVIGFSAGGHLACAAATTGRHRPKAAIIGYPVTGFDGRYGPDMYDCVAAVTRKTCPCFVFATVDDPVVDVMNSIKFIEALSEKNVPFESHFYSHGPHAFSTCDPGFGITDCCPRISDWLDDSAQWLSETM
ncbi:MAG: alpha/beta hydrolase [Lachnospiraceae bacterium]|jgi:acetyl esterase/lipase